MASQVFSTWGSWTPGREQVPTDQLPAEFAAGRPLRAFMGWDGLFIHDESVDLVDMARAYMDQAQKESCGQCFPCRLGVKAMSAILDGLCAGKGAPADLDRLESLARFVSRASRCDIGQTTPRPILDLLTHRRQAFLAAIEAKAPIARGRYVAQVTAPCINACPSHLDIPGYVEKIRDGRWDQALSIIRDDCCLPGVVGRVCVRPCEFNCRRQKLDEGIAIRALKRHAADMELASGREAPLVPGPAKEQKVAIIGAGPAGLACAYHLGLRGYKSTIFEVLNEPGGMAAVGIPDYRLPRRILRGEANQVERLGCEIRYGVNVGVDVTLDDLKLQGYGAIFVGVGAPAASKMRCEGEDAGYECFMTGVDFLRRVADGERPIEGDKLLIIGGGNVAMDCARSALRLGFTDVNLLYRRTRAEMPADLVEISEAQEEGIKFHYLVAPLRVIAANGKVAGLECQRMELGEPDASGRRRPVAIEGSEFVIECDAIVPAIGQVCVVDCVLPPDEVEISRRNTLATDDITRQTNQPYIFSGGDCVTGPAPLIAALDAGKNAARFIEQFLTNGRSVPEDGDHMERLIARLGVFYPREKMPYADATKKLRPPVMAPEVRIRGFDEVEGGVSPAQAAEEAARCLRCYRIAMAAL
ncbi:FAD-dependent pyridine nucleotide-disulfide oxidoreductase [Desulfarculus baarsii DSM 2075]|uniref:FAD-dependent pyridine nucleotide-disulfide oxidoreductase n=2 Tax=Desulfarculus baarsii TaxID=453230 RepID=E1QE74_DESB2|nr:FAD-dependent pyridine nucleotide-disulfide oxidoreductase [Desulfarculus baarsii DSM 2075]